MSLNSLFNFSLTEVWGALPFRQPALQDCASLRLREKDLCLSELRVGSA